MIKEFKLIHSLSNQMIPGCVQMVNKLCFAGMLKHQHVLASDGNCQLLRRCHTASSQLGCLRFYQEENKHVCDKRFRGS